MCKVDKAGLLAEFRVDIARMVPRHRPPPTHYKVKVERITITRRVDCIKNTCSSSLVSQNIVAPGAILVKCFLPEALTVSHAGQHGMA